MFQREHTILIIKSYYSNGNRDENGTWGFDPQFTWSVGYTWASIEGTSLRQPLGTLQHVEEILLEEWEEIAPQVI
jgi:hypothetical protein